MKFDYPPKNNTTETDKEKVIEKNNFSKFYNYLRKISLGVLLLSQLNANATNTELETGTDPKGKKETEKKTEANKEIDTKVYTVTNENIIESKESVIKRVEFNMINQFEVDSYEISKESIMKMQIDLQNLLNHIDETNYKSIIEDGLKIFTGTDERKTNRYIGGNEELASQRASEMKKIFLDFLKNNAIAPFLYTDEFNNLKENLKIEVLIPKSEKVLNAEKGVIYPEDIGVKRDDFNNMSLNEKEDVYQRCRVASIGIEAEISKEISFEKLNFNYNELSFMFDGSPSMTKSFKAFFDYLEKSNNIKTTNIKLGFYSGDKVNARFYRNINGVLSEIKNHDYGDGNQIEKAINASANATRAMSKSKEIKMVANFTDESLQKVSLGILENLMNISFEKNTINVIFYKDTSENIRLIRLDEIVDLAKEQLSREIKEFNLNKDNYKDHILKDIDLNNVGKVIKLKEIK